MDPSEFGMTDEQVYGVSGVTDYAAPSFLPLAPQQPQPQQVARPAQQRPTNPLDELDARLKLAQYYRAVVEQPLFGDMRDPFSNRVQAEVGEFVMGRIAELMGLGKKPGPGEFTPEEVQALKALAQRLLTVEEAPAAAPAPVQAPPPVRIAPRPAPPPQVAPRPAPAAPRLQPARPPVEEPEGEEYEEEAPPPPPKPRAVAKKPAKKPAQKRRAARPQPTLPNGKPTSDVPRAGPPTDQPQGVAGYIPMPTGRNMEHALGMQAMSTLQDATIIESNPEERARQGR